MQYKEDYEQTFEQQRKRFYEKKMTGEEYDLARQEYEKSEKLDFFSRNLRIDDYRVITDKERFGEKTSSRLSSGLINFTKTPLQIYTFDGDSLLKELPPKVLKEEMSHEEFSKAFDKAKQQEGNYMTLDSFMLIRKKGNQSERSPELKAVIDKLKKFYRAKKESLMSKGKPNFVSPEQIIGEENCLKKFYRAKKESLMSKGKPNFVSPEQIIGEENCRLTPTELKILSDLIKSSEISKVRTLMSSKNLDKGL